MSSPRSIPYLLAAAFLLAFAAQARPVSAQVTLIASSWVPASHALSAIQVSWCDEVAKATLNRVKCNILAKPVAAPPATFDAVRDGVADVSFSVHGYTPGRYTMTKFVEFPFMGDSAEATSAAYQKIFDRQLAKFDEHKGLKVLAVFTHGPGAIFNTRHPVAKMADLDGLKFRVGGGIVNDIGRALDINMTLKPSTQSYELISSGVMDGVFFPSESVVTFRLEKLIKYRTSFPGGLYNTSFAMVMNAATWDKIAKADQEAIAKLSGEALARRFGQAWDKNDREGNAVLQANGVQVVNAGKSFVDEVRARTSQIENDWIAEAKAKGMTDPAQVLKEYRALVAAN